MGRVSCDKCGRKKATKTTYYPEGFQRRHCAACHKSEMPAIDARLAEMAASAVEDLPEPENEPKEGPDDEEVESEEA